MAKVTYIHEEKLHNMTSPQIVVPVLMELFKPASVVDFGCGIGTFLKAFKQIGVKELFGLDGKWVDKNLLKKYISENEFLETDLTQTVKLNRKFDLAICFEVGEHLPASSARTFIESLTKASDIVVFGAAVPFQGGQNHINEQWPEYWAGLFAEFGYVQLDLIRPRLWKSAEVQVWYKQNVFAYVRKDSPFVLNQPAQYPKNFGAIHPDMYHFKAQKLELLQSGKAPMNDYLKMFVKSVLSKLGLR